MSQRLGIVILALFAACFVSSLAVGALALVSHFKASAAMELEERDRVDSRQEADPGPAAEEDPEVAEPSSEEAEVELSDQVEAAYQAPKFAMAQFAVFHFERARLDPWSALERVAKGAKVRVYRDEVPDYALPPYVQLRDLPVAEYIVVTGDILERGRGLTDEVRKALPRAKRVTVFDAAMLQQGQDLLEVSKLVAAFAKATGGVLWDEECQEYLSLDAWKSRRIDSWLGGSPDASMNFAVDVNESDGELRLSTAGLRHLGLPELELNAVAPDSQNTAIGLLDAVAQTLAESAVPPDVGPLEVKLSGLRHAPKRARLQEMARKNAQQAVEVVLVGAPGRDVPTLLITLPGMGLEAERVQAGIESVFGSPPSSSAQ